MDQRASRSIPRPVGASGSVLSSNGRFPVWSSPDVATVGDAAKTLTVGADADRQRWNTPLTTNRAVALSTSGAYEGATFRITRTAAATGASSLNVGTGPLKALAVSQWCDVTYDGSAWYLSAFGEL